MMYSDDQLQAIRELQEFINQPFDPSDCKRILTGGPGTGKTTIAAALAHRAAGPVVLCAPTQQAETVFSRIAKTEVQSLTALPDGATLMIDECSSIGPVYAERLQDVSCRCKTKVIFIGDEFQLGPVKGAYSIFDSKIPRLELKTPHRFSGKANGILTSAIPWRDAITTGVLPKIEDDSSIQALTKAEFKKQTSEAADNLKYGFESSLVIAFTKTRVQMHNSRICRAVSGSAPGPGVPFQDGDRLILGSGLVDEQSGATIAAVGTPLHDIKITPDQIRFTGAGEWNRVVRSILIGTWSISAHDDHRKYSVPQNPEKFKAFVGALKRAAARTSAEKPGECRRRWDAYWRARRLMADLNLPFARTIHNAQGDQFDHIFIDASDLQFAGDPKKVARLMFTAITRARSSVSVTGLWPDGSLLESETY